MEYKTVVTGMLGENCHLVYKNGECIVVDPGDEPEKIISAINDLNLTPVAIFLTHTHFDHVGACSELSERLNLPVYVSEKDYKRSNAEKESVYHMKGKIKSELVNFVSDGQEIVLGEMKFKVMETPGHSEGSVCYFCDDLMIAGDLLFREGIGRTDLDGGSTEKMKDTFINKILNLDESLTVLTGHGEITTIGYELRHNPYINYYYKKF